MEVGSPIPRALIAQASGAVMTEGAMGKEGPSTRRSAGTH